MWGILGGTSYCGVEYVVDGRVQGAQVTTEDVVVNGEGIPVGRSGGRARVREGGAGVRRGGVRVSGGGGRARMVFR